MFPNKTNQLSMVSWATLNFFLLLLNNDQILAIDLWYSSFNKKDASTVINRKISNMNKD